jgi:hypothetical protein
MEIIDGKTATFSMLDKNILLVTMKENAEVELADAKENYEIAMRLAKGNRYVSFVDARNYATITDEARNFSTQPFVYASVIAQAIVVSSLASRLIANFLITFHKKNKDVEMQLFNDYNKALNWLKQKLVEDKAGVVVQK